MSAGAMLALYTDGLVERRDRDIDTGIALLIEEIAAAAGSLTELPGRLVSRMLPGGQDDDVALLLARIPLQSPVVPTVRFAAGGTAETVATARHWVGRIVGGWDVPAGRRADAELLVGELVTNAFTHGAPPIEIRLRHLHGALMIEVSDSAPFLPRRLRPSVDDEHGRGLLLVAKLAQRWGVRPRPTGKAVWCVLGGSLPRPRED
jgi:anti-sigma regulatory factor (Ser/Thr protein kinase)